MAFYDKALGVLMKPLAGEIVRIIKAEGEASIPDNPRPRQAEYPTQIMLGGNYVGAPRRKYGATIDFDSLRTFSVVYDVVRACINHRKRQIENLEWAIIPKDDEAEPEATKGAAEKITQFFEEPSNGNDFRTWNSKIMEDLLVLDGAALWKDKTYGGELKELLPVDATTIRIRIGSDGTIPEPPDAAYQQVIYGEVKGEYTTEELIYKIMNPRNNTPYGLGPLEALIIGVDAALQSQLYNASMLKRGSIPEGFFGVPENWTPEQIKDYQLWFDTMLAGNYANNSGIKFMPGGKGVGYMPTKKPEDMRFLEFEKWLLLKTCAMFDVQPSDIGFIENLPQNPGDAQKQLGHERGLVPMANFLKQTYTKIIAQDFGRPDLKFEWKGLQAVDDDFELDRAKTMVQNGAMTINEWRVDQGRKPLKEEAADKPMIYTATGPISLENVDEPEEEDPTATPATEGDDQDGQAADEMDKWERKVTASLKRGTGIPGFKAAHIDEAAQILIRSRLSVAKSKEEVRAAFAPFKDQAVERALVNRAMKLRSDMSAHKRTRYERTRPSPARG